MINNTFFIVFRQASPKDVIPNPNQDRWGWEFADLIERTDYKQALVDMKEYQAAMPNYCVRLRPVRIGETYGRPCE